MNANEIVEAVENKLEYVEMKHILRVLEQCGGNRTYASETLGISIRTLRLKIVKYRRMGIDTLDHSSRIHSGRKHARKTSKIGNGNLFFLIGLLIGSCYSYLCNAMVKTWKKIEDKCQ